MNLPNGHPLQNGKYRLTHVVGQGGFGITYKGVWFTEVKGPLGTIKTEVPICVKEYFFKDYCYREPESYAVRVHSETGRTLFDKFKEKLIKEAKILSEVHHPHIVNVLEVFEENDTAYIAMEYISGNSLKYMMDKEGVLPEAKVLRFVHQIGEALQFVHEKNILHLDIKPSNILIDQSGKARLIDFGVSKRYDIEQQETSTTMLTLSKGFASVEQYDNEGTQVFSPCPDIYSLGATMYNLLTGKIPTESILRATRPLLSPTEINPSITVKTEAVIIKAMQIIPADRFQSVADMLAALDRPPAEEVAERNNISPPEYSDDDTTILFNTRLPQPNGTDDDETVLNDADQPAVPKKKNRKATLISLLIIIFASIGSAVALLVQRYKPVSPVAEVVNTASDMNDTNNVPAVMDELNDPDTENADDVTHEQKEQPAPEIKPEVKQDVKPEVITPQPETEKKAAEPVVDAVESSASTQSERSEEEINAEYLSLINSGKDKMTAGDFSGAKADFTKASEIRMTQELFDLIGDCKLRENEQILAERKAKYEEKMPFGPYIIVRKKSNGNYGAVDADAIERIPCKYKNVGKADNGRAFERADGLFDIYNTEGVLISEGLPYY